MFNKVYLTSEAPEDWKIGIIAPLHKKGYLKDCNNYRAITLLSTIGKTFARILETKLRDLLENTIEDTQFGFRPNRGVTDANFILRQIIEKAFIEERDIHLCFVDLEKAFDNIKREDIWRTLHKRGVKHDLIIAVQSLYKETKNYVRTRHETSKMFETSSGVRQGCILSPLLFTVVLDDAIKEAKKEVKQYFVGHWNLDQIKISEITYADDMVLVGKDEETLTQNVKIYNEKLESINMRININKTKTMIIGNHNEKHTISLGDAQLEQVGKFKYLGTQVTKDGRLEEDISERIVAGGRLFNSLKNNLFR